MRVLIVSHNVLSQTGNMGKTISAYFSAFKPENLAQFYIHSEVPTTAACFNYYRVTDKEAVKSIFTRKCGKIFIKKDVQLDRITPRTDEGNVAKIYQKARKRTPLIYFLRNLWWDLSAWNNKKFNNWVNNFNPDVVFFASGDYAFAYKIALKIAKKRNIPLVISCMDDYYFNNKNKNRLGGKLLHKMFMSTVRKTMEYASCIFAISDSMASEYSALFNKKCYTFHTPATFSENSKSARKNAICYLGNLGYNRHLQILKLGKALKVCNDCAPKHIDVYSAETREEIIKDFTLENGIIFHGAVSAKDVEKIISQSKYVIHAESFDEENRKVVKYSVSTKIADSLMSGACIIAYGPKEIASISYLKEHDAAFVIDENDSLVKKLNQIFNNSQSTESIVDNAVNLANKNHSLENNSLFLLEKLKEVIDESITG